MRRIGLQLFVLCSGLLAVHTQSTETSLFNNSGRDKEEGDHYAVLRSRFNQYFSSFPHGYQNFSGFNGAPQFSVSSPQRSVPAQTELVMTTNNSSGISGADSTPAFSNLFINSPGNYVAKTFVKDGRRQKHLVYPKPLLKFKPHSASRFPNKPFEGHRNGQSQLGEGSSSYGTNEEQIEEARQKPYRVAYAVKSKEVNNYFNREESSDGRRVTGQYRVLLPDGRIQTVIYAADKENGYNAVVTYKGTAKENTDTDVPPPKPIHSTHAPKSAVVSALQMGGSSLTVKIIDSAQYNSSSLRNTESSAAPEQRLDSNGPNESTDLTATSTPLLNYYRRLNGQSSRYAGNYADVSQAKEKSSRKIQQLATYPQGFHPSPRSEVSGFMPSYYGNLLYGVTPALVPTQISPTSPALRPVMPEMARMIPVQPGKLAVLMAPLPSLTLAPPEVDAEGLDPSFTFSRPGSLYHNSRDKLIVRCSHFNHRPWNPILHHAPLKPVNSTAVNTYRNVSDGSLSAAKPPVEQSAKVNSDSRNETTQTESSVEMTESSEEAIADSSDESPMSSINYEIMSAATTVPLTFASDMEEMEHFMNFQLSKTDILPPTTTTSRPEILATRLRESLRSVRRKLQKKQAGTTAQYGKPLSF